MTRVSAKIGPTPWLALVMLAFMAMTSWSQQAGDPPQAGEPPPTGEELADPGMEFVPGEILIKFVAGAPAAAERGAAQRVGATRLQTFPNIGVQHWRLARGLSVEQALEILSKPPFRDVIQYAEPNYLLHAHDFPNDPRRGDLWGLHNIGQTGGTKDADIDAPEAWSQQTGSSSIVVGVIDTGIDYTHEDLLDNIWLNPRETPNDGVDDDGNGFVDDVMGWDFVNNDNDPYDDNGHGTHVAGTIGARGNNGIGVAGVNWTVSLVGIKFLNAGGSGSTDNAIKSVNYAASLKDANGNPVVRITNNSWGGGSRSRSLQDAIANSGALFVASAGNSGSSGKQYPAAYALPNVVAVAATDHNDALASFSTYGSWVHLAAPGVNTLSTVPGNGYGNKSGTSMAAPHASGVAALVMAQSPGISVADTKSQILNNVDVLSSLAGKTSTGGRLNARRAVGVASEISDSISPDPVGNLAVVLPPTPSSVTLSWTATGDDGSAGTAYAYDVRYSTSPIAGDAEFNAATQANGEPLPQAAGLTETFVVAGLQSNTTYYFAMKVADEVGNLSSLSNVVSATTPTGGWKVETVDSIGDVGFYNALAYDPSGNPAIAYSDETNSRIKFAHWNGTSTSWDIEVIGSGSGSVDLAYSSGAPSVSWVDGGKLKFASRSGSSWSITIVEKSNVQADVTSLVYNGGNPSISYRMFNKGLKFAQRVGGAWQTQVVDAGAGARYNSLAYDPVTGYPSIAYSDDIDGDNWLETLQFAWWNGSAWQTDIVETGVEGYGVFSSLAYDPLTQFPSIVHRAGGFVRFLRWNGTDWVLGIVDAGTNCSLDYDASGIAYVGYVNSPPQVRVARRELDGTWTPDTVEVGAGTGWPVSLEVDGAGIPSLSYRDSTNRDLKYARKQVP